MKAFFKQNIFCSVLPWFRLHMWGPEYPTADAVLSLPYERQFHPDRLIAYPVFVIASFGLAVATAGNIASAFSVWQFIGFLLAAVVFYGSVNYCWGQERISVDKAAVHFYKRWPWGASTSWSESLLGYNSLVIVKTNYNSFHLLLRHSRQGATVALAFSSTLNHIEELSDNFQKLLGVKSDPEMLVYMLND